MTDIKNELKSHFKIKKLDIIKRILNIRTYYIRN